MIRRGVGLPLATGLLLALAFPPLHLVVPPFVALAPLAVHLDALGAGKGRAAFRSGVVAGGVAWALLLAWIPPALAPWSFMALPLYVLAVAVLAGVTGAVAVGVHGLRYRVGLPLALALPLGWTAGEWVRAHLPGPLAFPWLELGVSLAGRPEWIGIAEVVGGRGVSFWLAAVAGLLAMAWGAAGPASRPSGGGARRSAAKEAGGRPALRPGPGSLALAACAAVLAVAVPVWGTIRAGGIEARPVARVAVVQPGVSGRTHPDVEERREAVREALERLTPELEAAAVDLVVLPEVVLPDVLNTAAGATADSALVQLARRAGAPVMAGALVAGWGRMGEAGEAGDREAGAVHNSVVLVDGTGRGPWRHDKRHLVPMVERVPLPPLPGVPEGFAGYAPGRGGEPARVGPERLAGAFVCYESAFSRVSRGLVAAGADFLVNVTNDGWFEWAGGPTHALWQHPAHLVLRAVETRTGIARAASTGFSFFVDPAGRVAGRTEWSAEAVSVATLRTAPGPTLFVRAGDVIGLASALATGLLLVATAMWRSRHIRRSNV